MHTRMHALTHAHITHTMHSKYQHYADWEWRADAAVKWNLAKGKDVAVPFKQKLLFIHITYVIELCIWLLRASVDHEEWWAESQHEKPDGRDSPTVRRPNGDRLIEENLCCYCLKTFEMARGKKERWCRWESNPGPPALTKGLRTHDSLVALPQRWYCNSCLKY